MTELSPTIHLPDRTERPWGWFETVSEQPGFKIKRIGVLPGRQISLQRHRHRAEHWVVVRGIATVTVGDRVADLQVGHHVDVATGEVHRLANRTAQDMEIVEVQLGARLDEDDIERLQDDFGRT
jgi:mannose-6-phosphate isomerase-like protein (cupin superfamily)